MENGKKQELIQLFEKELEFSKDTIGFNGESIEAAINYLKTNKFRKNISASKRGLIDEIIILGIDDAINVQRNHIKNLIGEEETQVVQELSNDDIIKFDKTPKTLIQILEKIGVNAKIKNQEENGLDLYMGRKKFTVTFGENFIRIFREGDRKIQLAYESKKNTLNNIQKRLLEVK